MPQTWYKVDNAAKVFLATHTKRDPRVFRLSCTLTEEVDPDLLTEALVRTAREWPQFQVSLHRGLFWHYMEPTEEAPRAKPEDKPPCAPLYVPERRNRLLYRVSYYGARINLEMFHVLTDGNGGFVYLQSIVNNYLALAHPGEFDGSAGVPGMGSAAAREQDSFRNFYAASGSKVVPQKKKKAFRFLALRLPYDQLQFFEGHLSASQVLAKARALGVSLTSYLGASLMLAIYAEMPVLERKMPISISLPVNLRNYYPSETARNFFNSIYVALTVSEEDTLETLAPLFDATLREAVKPESIRRQMDEFEKLEHMPAIRPIPLFIKNWVVGCFCKREGKQVTAVLSNMGVLKTPAALAPYTKGYTAFSSTDSLFTCVCSYGDDLVLGTASAYRSTNALRRMYAGFAESGLDVTLYATEVEK